MIKAAIYARASSDCPISVEDQSVLLKAVAAEHSWAVANVFVDRPMTAKKGKERRPGEAALLDVIRRGEIRKVLILGIDRVGRSLVELVTFMDVCRNADVAVYLHDQHVDTAESNGMTLFDLTSMMALHVRQSRRDAILRGQAAARSLSIKFGRPPLCTAKVEKAKNELAAGKGVRQVARLAGISRASVSRLKAATCISGQGLGSLRLEAHRVCMN